MQYRWISVPLSAALLLCGSAAVAADDTKSTTKPAGATQSKAAEPAKGGAQKKKPKPVEINSATAAQLKSVPGIGDEDAQRIIINRPYMTRSHLVTKNVLSYDTYLAVKDYLSVVPPDPKATK